MLLFRQQLRGPGTIELRIHHDYQVGDKELITSNDIHRKLNCPTKGPYPIVQVYSNGTVHVQNAQ